MKKFAWPWLVLIMAMLCFSPKGAAASNTTVITERGNGQSVTVNKGALLEIQLQGNITTGYSWDISNTTGNAIQRLGKVQYAPGQSKLVGSGGTFTARFLAANAGASTVSMTYSRPWEKNTAPAKTFKITVQVK